MTLDLLSCSPRERRAFFTGIRARSAARVMPTGRPAIGALPGEQDLLVALAERRGLRPDETFAEVAAWLDHEGWSTRTGVAWTRYSVRKVLRALGEDPA